jgi:hypothetical protein
MTRHLRWACFVIGILLTCPPVNGQSLGHYLPGVAGLGGGSTPPPGFYLTYLPYISWVDSVKGSNGLTLVNADLRQTIQAVQVTVMTRKKIFGATYGASFLGPFSGLRLDSELLPSGSASTFGYTDTGFIPVILGWDKKYADVVATYAFYAPTGAYDPTKAANVGLGFWEHQIQLGTTYHPDAHKTVNASLLSTWEINRSKEGKDLTPGPMFTAEFGLGKTLMKGFLQVGGSGYYYRKLIPDSGSARPPLVQGLNDQALGLGPEVHMTLPVAAPTRLISLVAKYQWQVGVEARPHGEVLVLSLTYLNIFKPK